MNSDTTSSGSGVCSLRYRNKVCYCGLKAGIKVTQNERNKGKLYWVCPKGTCKLWEWCTPMSSGSQSVTEQAIAQRPQEEASSNEVQTRMKIIEGNLAYMKLLIIISLALSFLALYVAIMK